MLEAAARGEDGGALWLLNTMGTWVRAISDLQAGTGHAADLSPAMRQTLVRELVAHRQRLLVLLDERFQARVQGRPSDEAISDKDLSVIGDDAGARLVAARQFLDQLDPHWREHYRMGLLIDPSRVSTVQEHLSRLEPAERARVEQRVTRDGELFALARRVRDAPAAERESMLSGLDAVARTRVEGMADMTQAARDAAHDAALQRGDALLAALRNEPDPARAARLAADITYEQMYANMLNDDAYITPGAVGRYAQGGGADTPAARYQALVDQIDSIGHQVHENGGVLAAMRRYEIFKYIQRYCEMARRSGLVADEDMARLNFFEHWAEYVYRVEREAAGSAADTPGRRVADSAAQSGVRLDAPVGPDATRPGVPDDFLLQNYADFREWAEAQAQRLRNAALGGEAGAPLVRLPQLTAEDTARIAAAREAAARGAATTTPAGGPAAAGATPILGRANTPLGQPVASEAAGQAIVRRLAAGDAAALQELGVTPPPAYDSRGREFGLGRRADGSIVVIEGDVGGVSWDDFLAAGGVPLAHSHPLTAGREMRGPGRTIYDLLRRHGSEDLDTVLVLPSSADFLFCGRHGVRTHDVHTPYAHIGGGRIANPDPATPRPLLSFRINDSELVGHLNGMEVYRSMLIAYDGSGDVLLMTPVYALAHPRIAGVGMEPPSGMVPVTPGGGGGAGGGGSGQQEEP
jgi:hypothetical protein